MKKLIIFLLLSSSSFAQTGDRLIDFRVEEGRASINWQSFEVESLIITLPNNQKITFPTLGEHRLNLDSPIPGRYLIEFIFDRKTVNSIKIEI